MSDPEMHVVTDDEKNEPPLTVTEEQRLAKVKEERFHREVLAAPDEWRAPEETAPKTAACWFGHIDEDGRYHWSLRRWHTIATRNKEHTVVVLAKENQGPPKPGDKLP